MKDRGSPDKQIVSVRMPLSLLLKIKKAAKHRVETQTEFINAALYHATQNISLTPEDHQEIARAIQQNTAGNRNSAAPFGAYLDAEEGGGI